MALIKTNIKDKGNNFAKLELALLYEEKYKNLKHIDIVIYSVLKNQEGLSINQVRAGRYDYVDSEGNIFISIRQEKICKLLNTTKPTLQASFKRLEDAELLENVQIGKNKCNRIYVGQVETNITFGEYFKELNLEFEAEEEKKTASKVVATNVSSIKVDDLEKSNLKKGMKKASVSAEANKTNIKNNKSSNYYTTDLEKVNHLSEKKCDTNNSQMSEAIENTEVVKEIKNSCVAIKKVDLEECSKVFTDIERLRKALKTCEEKQSNGIKALKMAYNSIKATTTTNNSKWNNGKGFNAYEGTYVNDDDLDARIEQYQFDKFEK